MSRYPRPFVVVALVMLAGTLANPAAQAPAPERVDLDAVYRIKDEGLQRSQVMDTAWYLTEVHGPRLTNSPNIRAAADWADGPADEWGLGERRAGDVGPVRPRLGQRAVRRQRRGAAAVSADRLPARLDARHQRRRSPATPCMAVIDARRGLQAVGGQAEGQDRADAATARGARRCSRALGPPLHRQELDRPAGAAGRRRPRRPGRRAAAARRRTRPSPPRRDAVLRHARASSPCSSRATAATITARSW